MGLKKFYYKLEDKYYDFVERTGLYKITDKIDKVMPSFILFILLILIIISGLVFLLLPGGKVIDGIDIHFQVKDAETGAYLENVPLTIITSQGTDIITTKEEGLTDNIKLQKDTMFRVDVLLDDYLSFSEEYFVDDILNKYILFLEPHDLTPPQITTTFSVINSETGAVVNSSGSINFKCLNPGVTAPSSKQFNNGNISVSHDADCQLGIQSITFSGYTTKYNLSIGNTGIRLDPTSVNFSDNDHKLTINVTNESLQPLSNIKISLTDSLGVVGAPCTTGSSGNCTFNDLSTGSYDVVFSDQRANPIYENMLRTYYVSSDMTQNITLSSDVKGFIYVRVVAAGVGSIEDAEVSLKSTNDNTLIGSSKFSDINGEVIFTVSEIKGYNVVVDAEGYLIESKVVTAQEVKPTNPTMINLEKITPQTLATLNVRVLDWEGKGFKFARVMLFDADTGFITNYKPQITNYDGNVSFRVSSGNYIAKATKGSSVGESVEFDFDVKFPNETPLTVTMPINEGILNVKVVDPFNNPVPFARVDLYDRYSYYNFTPPIMIISDTAGADGTLQITRDADVDYYVVAYDLDDVYGKTQSRFVTLNSESPTELVVRLHEINGYNTRPEMKLTGIYRDGQEISGTTLKSGEDYEFRFNLLVPQNRTGNDRFEEIGFMLRTGLNSRIENDSLYIKELDVPYVESIQKYTQFNLNSPHETEGFLDQDSLTEGIFKWAKATFKEGPVNYEGNFGFFNVYEVSSTITIKESSVFGEPLNIFYLGYGLREDGTYETFTPYLGPNQAIEYFNVYSSKNYGIGHETLCSSDFCFSSNIVDVLDDLRYDVTDSYGAKPNKTYEYNFTLTNNHSEEIYQSSRFYLNNIDKGLDILNIRIVRPNGEVHTQNNITNHTIELPITQMRPGESITGTIEFIPKLIGTRNLTLQLRSNQQVRFTNQLFVDVASEKEFVVDVDPEIVPAGKNFNLFVDLRDKDTLLPVEDATVTIKDKFRNVIKGPLNVSESTGEIMITNIQAQGPNDVIYIYVTSPEYTTHITELTATDRLFSVVPRNLGYSLNVFNEREKVENFTINNLSSIPLTIDTLEVRGTGLETIDVIAINNALKSSAGVVIEGLDTLSDFPDNTNASKEIPLKISLNPRADAIRELQNISSVLKIILSNGENRWVHEIPVSINVGFDGMLDNSNCLTASEGFWKGVSMNTPINTTFSLSNNCSINNQRIALSNGVEARVMFDSNPQGKFILNIDNKFVELTHGSYRPILDVFERDRQYPVTLRYEPVGRMTGTVKGKIQIRSLNSTGTGDQELLTEYMFEIDVTNLKDCSVVSKTSLNIGQAPDEFIIENKGCPTDMFYRLSCDDCAGIRVDPISEIYVSATGTSQPITLTASSSTTPGAYILNVYGGMQDARASEELVKRIKVYVRPTDYCIDLERYEFDLYRSEYSESTGLLVGATSYDTTNLINLCYGQEVSGTFVVKENAKWQMAAVSFVRDGVFTGILSELLQSGTDGDKKFLGGLFSNLTKWFKKDTPDGDASDGEGDGSTDEINNLEDSSNKLIKEVNEYIENVKVDSMYQDLPDKKIKSFISDLESALSGNDILKIKSAKEELEKAFEEFKEINPTTPATPPNQEPPAGGTTFPEISEVIYTDKNVTSLQILSQSIEAYEERNKSDYTPDSWLEFVNKYNTRAEIYNRSISATIEKKGYITKKAYDRLILIFNTYISNILLELVEVDTSSVEEERLKIAKNADTGSACNRNKIIDDSDDEFLFNIRPNNDPYVYVCSGSQNYRACVNGKWSKNYKYDDVYGKTHLVNECENIN